MKNYFISSVSALTHEDLEIKIHELLDPNDDGSYLYSVIALSVIQEQKTGWFYAMVVYGR